MFKCLSLAVLLAAGCTFDSSNQLSGDGGGGGVPDGQPGIDASVIDAAVIDAAIVDAAPVDAAPDANVDGAPDATPCVGDIMGFDLLNMDRCDPSDPITDLILNISGNYIFDGDNNTLTDPDNNVIPLVIDVVPQVDGDDLLIVTVTDLVVVGGARLRLLGARPIVIISTGDMSIAGRVQATRLGLLPGAGANIDTNCGTGAGTDGALQTDSNTNDAGSGGGGAGFGTAGGFGARIVNSNGDNSPGGAEAVLQTLEPLRGGCPGGTGGNTGGGAGGFGGGALHLAAAGTLTITGAISASGSGGSGVEGVRSGGGGAGSGGAVLIQAGTLVNNGIITTNGGAGGEGSAGATNTDSGDNGSITSDNAANGGSGFSNGGNGGDGATVNDGAGDGTEGNQSNSFARGSGGGGGGLGVVRIETVN